MQSNDQQSYYGSDFPNVLLGSQVFSWKIARETARLSTVAGLGQPAVTKMRVMEWAVKGLYQITDKQVCERKAYEIYQNERALPLADQTFGNLLALLLAKVDTSNIKAHEQIEHVFKFMLGIESSSPDTNPLFNQLFSCIMDYTCTHEREMPGLAAPRPEVVDYLANIRNTAEITRTPVRTPTEVTRAVVAPVLQFGTMNLFSQTVVPQMPAPEQPESAPAERNSPRP